MWTYNCDTELYHYGVLGMKWGKRKSNYSSTGVRSAIAKKQNEKIDKSFKKWNENSKKKADAIDLGKKRNLSKMAYESNRKDKTVKTQYKQDNKAYKKAIRSNTTYRKGAIKKEVGSDISRKYLSEAKKVKKQMTADPSNKQLQKQYNKLMSKHDVERARARRAPEVANNRMRKKASIKRAMTMSVKAAAASAAVAGGTYAANRYLAKHNYTLNDKPIRVSPEAAAKFNNAVRAGKNLFKYV